MQMPFRAPLTTETEINVQWPILSTQMELGGSTCSILSYNLQWDRGTSNSWEDLTGIFSIFLASEYLVTNQVIPSKSYKFRVRAKNKYGWGQYSQPVAILAADIPDASLLTSSIQNLTNVTLSWDTPVEHGAVITAYEILIKNRIGIYIQSLTCNGSFTLIVQQR